MNHRNAPIHYRRIELQKTQEEMAASMDIHRVTLAKLERYRLNPGRKLASKIALVTRQTPGEVIDEYHKHRRSA